MALDGGGEYAPRQLSGTSSIDDNSLGRIPFDSSIACSRDGEEREWITVAAPLLVRLADTLGVGRSQAIIESGTKVDSRPSVRLKRSWYWSRVPPGLWAAGLGRSAT